MSNSRLRTLAYWTALPSFGLLVGACTTTPAEGDKPTTEVEAGVSDAAGSETASSDQSNPAPTTPTPNPPATPDPSQSSAPDHTEPQAPNGNPPSATVFPVGLAVESLLSRQRADAPNVALLQWQDPNGNELTAAEQIQRALMAQSADDCAVILPPLAPPPNPSCYGPALNYGNHPDGVCEPPPENSATCKLPSGDLGIWNATEGDSPEACTAAKFNADVNAVGLRVDLALVIAASAVCTLVADGQALPAPGETAETATALATALSRHQPDIEVVSATIENASNADGETLIYSVESIHNGHTIRYVLEHHGSAAGAYSGKLWGSVTQNGNQPPPPNPELQAYVVVDAGEAPPVPPSDASAPPPCEGPDCPPPCQGDYCPPPPECGDGGVCLPPLPCEGPNCPPPPCQGENCPPPPPSPPPGDAGMAPPPCEGPDCPSPPQCGDGGVCPPLLPCEGLDCPPAPCQGENCPPPCAGENCPPVCQGPNCPAPCEGPECPTGPGGEPAGGDAELFSVSYELTSDKHLRTRMLTKNGAVAGAEAFTEDGDLAPTGAWNRSMSLTVLDVDAESRVGKGAYLWQAGPFDDRTRVFNVFTEASDEGDKTGCGFFGFGSPFGETLPNLGIENFICNWAGPSNDHVGNAHTAQKQCMALSEYGVWEPTVSHIAYAPSNSCGSNDAAFAGGPDGSDSSQWTPFAEASDLVDLTVDADYASGFGAGPSGPAH